MNEVTKAAKEARQLLENPRFNQAFENVEQSIIDNLKSVPVGNEQARLELVISLQVLEALRKDIENDINTALLEAV